MEKSEKYPNPAIVFCGAFNLKNSGSPGSSPLNRVFDPGFQKFTSSTGGTTVRR
jgi:hypothetical protein